MTDDSPPVYRRRFLVASAVATSGVFAGCSFGSGGNGTDSPNDDDGNTGTTPDGATATPFSRTPVECGTALPLEITANTVLQEGCQYTMPGGEVHIREGATLAIQPGVTVVVEEGGRLDVEDGRLLARGTQSSPISFEGRSSEAGHWQGIRINTEMANELSHVTVAHGGGSTFKHSNLGVGIQVSGENEGPGRVAIRNCEFRNSSGNGVRATSQGTIETFENNHVADNASAPIQLHPRHLGALSGTSTFANNGESYVNVKWVDPNTVETDATWANMDIPYRFGVESDDSLFLTARIEIEAGTRIESVSFPIRVDPPGQLVANGTEADPIEFVGTKDSQGAWGGLQINTEAENELTHAVVSDGGGTFSNANVGLSTGRRGSDDPGRVTVRNCEISDSAGWGILVDDGELTAANNTFSNNASGDIRRPDG